MLSLGSGHHQFTHFRVCVCVSLSWKKKITFYVKVFVINEWFKLSGCHIKHHSGFEETELGCELNRELCCRSKSTKDRKPL